METLLRPGTHRTSRGPLRMHRGMRPAPPTSPPPALPRTSRQESSLGQRHHPPDRGAPVHLQPDLHDPRPRQGHVPALPPPRRSLPPREASPRSPSLPLALPSQVLPPPRSAPPERSPLRPLLHTPLTAPGCPRNAPRALPRGNTAPLSGPTAPSYSNTPHEVGEGVRGRGSTVLHQVQQTNQRGQHRSSSVTLPRCITDAHDVTPPKQRLITMLMLTTPRKRSPHHVSQVMLTYRQRQPVPYPTCGKSCGNAVLPCAKENP